MEGRTHPATTLTLANVAHMHSWKRTSSSHRNPAAHTANLLKRKDVVHQLDPPERSIYRLDDASFETVLRLFTAIPRRIPGYAYWYCYLACNGFSKFHQIIHPNFKELLEATPNGKDTLLIWHGIDGFCLDFRGLEVADTYARSTRPKSTVFVCIRESVDKLCVRDDKKGNELWQLARMHWVEGQDNFWYSMFTITGIANGIRGWGMSASVEHLLYSIGEEFGERPMPRRCRKGRNALQAPSR